MAVTSAARAEARWARACCHDRHGRLGAPGLERGARVRRRPDGTARAHGVARPALGGGVPPLGRWRGARLAFAAGAGTTAPPTAGGAQAWRPVSHAESLAL